MSYQFIVITMCQERKQTIARSFIELGVDESIIYYLEASTPENSQEYFVNTSFEPKRQKVICCCKSHCRAIEYAAKNSSPEYSVIIEDDAAFHKTDFVKIIQEIIANWESHFSHCHYVSLGWVPCNNYDKYLSKKSFDVKTITQINNSIIFLNDFKNVGLQCYMVKKNKIQTISTALNKSNINELKISLNELMYQIYGKDVPSYSDEAVDCLLNRIMTCEIIFPPLVIEQKNVMSFLEHDNFNHYWKRFFEGHEEMLHNYMSY